MQLRSSRLRALAAAALAAGTLGAVPGLSSAEWAAEFDRSCENAPAEVFGIGASFQREAQRAWGADIIGGSTGLGGLQGAVAGCETADIRYEASGSGSGLTEFAIRGTGARDTRWAYAGTDDAPTAAELARGAENQNGAGADDTPINVIPVAQGAIAVSLNLPANCSLADADRRIEADRLEGAFRYDTGHDQWSEIIEGLEGEGCNTSARFTRVVRSDVSGTTDQFKRYLSASGNGAWTGLANTEWPNSGSGLISGSGNGGVVTRLQEVSGIGYHDLATGRSTFGHNGSEEDDLIWVRVEQSPETGGNGTFHYPATNQSSSATSGQRGANCSRVTYQWINGGTRRGVETIGSASGEDWNPVTAIATREDYPICILTYALAYQDYSQAGFGTAAAPRVAFDYLTYVTGTTGQGALPAADFSRLPETVRGIGAELVRDDILF